MLSGETRSQTFPTSHETMPSPTQKSTHVNNVTGFSKNSVDCSVVLKSPPTSAIAISSTPTIVDRADPKPPHRRIQIGAEVLGRLCVADGKHRNRGREQDRRAAGDHVEPDRERKLVGDRRRVRKQGQHASQARDRQLPGLDSDQQPAHLDHAGSFTSSGGSRSSTRRIAS